MTPWIIKPLFIILSFHPINHHSITVKQKIQALPDSLKCIVGLESSGRNVAGSGQNYGYYQFYIGTWQASVKMGGLGQTGLPTDYSFDYQTKMAELLVKMQGWGAWPNTSRMCGLI